MAKINVKHYFLFFFEHVNKYKHTHTHTHKYIYIYMYLNYNCSVFRATIKNETIAPRTIGVA